MATAEIVREQVPSVTRSVYPFPGSVIPGSVQEFQGSARLLPRARAVFFAAHSDPADEPSPWETLLRERIRAVYHELTVLQRGSAGVPNEIAWERLNLDLMRIASLEPDWDGEGAEPVQQSAATNTQTLLLMARQAAQKTQSAQCAPPELVPTVEGGVTLKWIRGRRELQCTVFAKVVEVIRWTSPDRYESDGYWEVPVGRLQEDFKEHFDWILRP